MTDFDKILDDCLNNLASGASSVDECLLRYPQHASLLEPLLRTAVRLEQGRALKPSVAFKARTRAKLTQHMQANPSRKVSRAPFMFWKFATSFAVILLALLITGTAYAQSANPGDSFYSWKIASELVWRAVSPDPVRTDINIANRRIDEMNKFPNDPVRWAEAWEGYLEVVTRLESELDADTLKSILPIELEQEPIEVPQQPVSTPTVPMIEIPTQTPEGTIIPLPSLPEPNQPIPRIIPTIQIPPPIR